MSWTRPGPGRLLPRDDASSKFVELISNPFNTELSTQAFWSTLGYSVGAAALFTLAFCLLRPYNNTVYAPRLKHADEKHAPPAVTKGVFAWVQPVIKTREQMLVDKVGLDATIFLRFTKMCRNILIILSMVGCGVYIPLNLVENAKNNIMDNVKSFMKFTPLGVWGKACWAHVLLGYVFDGVVCYFIWSNYRAITDVPKELRTDEGVNRIVDEVRATDDHPRGVIARNVKDLPDLIEQHERAVRELEEVLANYLKNPNRLPPNRPTCKTEKKDRSYTPGTKVDAIDYLTSRIKSLEIEIKEVRLSVDNRNALRYGFASYESIEDAHGVAYAARNKHPHKTTIKLAPKPSDIIWKNLSLEPRQRRWRKFVNNAWVTALTLVWTVPNGLIAVFLSNLSNLGQVWPAFQTELSANPKTWAAVQGILAPLITTLFYFFLPAIFRRLSMNAGDYSKTSRERHVTHKLYAFFIFNNLIVFSLFSTAWKYAVAVIEAEKETDVWTALVSAHPFNNLMTAFCDVSPFWLNYLLQRNFAAAWDLSQLGNMAWGYCLRTFTSPTPRRVIQLTAPPPFDYAAYYNYFLYYTTIALVFAPFQPLVLVVAAAYFTMDSYLKKYLLLYVFITKHESGGCFWRVLINRMLFATLLGNIVAALFVVAKGETYTQAACMIPLLFLLGGFKWYCMRTFDDDMHYYSKGSQKGREEGLPERKKHRDRLGVRFGHPALYRTLMTPMVHAKSQHLLKEVYRGRLDADMDGASTGYGDTYDMQKMSKSHPGKSAGSNAPFELVNDSQLDFENFRNRPDFREEFGGDGELYGRPSDMSRPGTPSTFQTGYDSSNGSRPGSPAFFNNTGSPYRGSQDSDRTFTEHEGGGATYPAGYHQPMPAGMQSQTHGNMYTATRDFSDVNLVGSAAPMGHTNRAGYNRLDGGEAERGMCKFVIPRWKDLLFLRL
ncbi:hypothetical protein GTA08_BOTSDO04198 [Neofusicoccum parvum]|nr:hypothetical protein GTA08_BOTSDO04198 [Neofusicoccum parvum]